MSNLPTLYVPDEEIYQLEPGQARPWAYVTRGEAERADAGKVHEYVPASRLAEAERERVKALVALLVRARQVVVALYDGRDTDDGLLARIDAATEEK